MDNASDMLEQREAQFEDREVDETPAGESAAEGGEAREEDPAED